MYCIFVLFPLREMCIDGVEIRIFIFNECGSGLSGMGT